MMLHVGAVQMAMSGLRELSVIQTPPVDRLAVRTYVIPWDPVVLREGGGLTGLQLTAFLLGLFGMLMLAWVIYQMRLREEFVKERVEAVKAALEG